MDLGGRNNKMVILTGATGGIGAYLLKRFPEVIGDRIGVTDYKEIEDVLSKIRLSRIVLINCAGIPYSGMAHKADPQEWGRVIDVNLKGTFNMIRYVLPIMRKEGYGRIINFSSVVTRFPVVGVSAYAASKAGVEGLTMSLAKEASKGITVNAIRLGYTNVGMIRDVPDPPGRLIDPEEIFKTVKYLIESEINGSIMNL